MTIEHRARQLSARNAALARLLSLWRTVDSDNLDTVQLFAENAVPVVDTGHARSASLAAAYYQRVRPRGITTLAVPPVDPPAPMRTVGLLRGAGLAGFVNGRRRGMTPERALRNGFAKVAGSASGLILAGGRDTLLSTSQQDPAATGRWQRIAGANSCEFCSRLAGRGFVFSETTSDFAAHSNCGCSIEPEFS